MKSPLELISVFIEWEFTEYFEFWMFFGNWVLGLGNVPLSFYFMGSFYFGKKISKWDQNCSLELLNKFLGTPISKLKLIQ